MSRLDAVVTGGGTSGHVVPALAVLELLEDSGVPSTALGYVGCRRGVERRLLASVPYATSFLPIAGLQRSFNVRSVARNIVLPLRVVVSYVLATALALRWRPRVVVSVGGYASAPFSFAARILRVPLVCVSYDAIPGLATRRQARHAALCATAFPGSKLPHAQHTGAPVRRAIRTLDRDTQRGPARDVLGIPRDRILVTVMGGSQGSAVLNDAIIEMLNVLDALGESIAVLHICGDRFNALPLPEVPARLWYRRVGYEPRMAEILAATDVLVCRGGAGTIAEIATVGVASVIVPWKDAADDHQRRNAEWLSNSNAAVVLDEAHLAQAGVARTVAELVGDSDRREEIAQRARDLGELNRQGALADAVMTFVASGSRLSA